MIVQHITQKKAGFTLVEIMIVIIIILLVLALGNYAGLLQYQERARVEEISVALLGLIDEAKTDSLLGKTAGIDHAIVRQRSATITYTSGTSKITFESKINKASEDEATFTTMTTQTWSLPTLKLEYYICPIPVGGGTFTVTLDNLIMTLRDDTMKFSTTTAPPPTIPDHIILLISRSGQARELHIDRRTGLTYERAGTVGAVTCE